MSTPHDHTAPDNPHYGKSLFRARPTGLSGYRNLLAKFRPGAGARNRAITASDVHPDFADRA